MLEVLIVVGIGILIADMVRIESNNKKTQRILKTILRFQVSQLVDSQIPPLTKFHVEELLKIEGFSEEEIKELLKG